MSFTLSFLPNVAFSEIHHTSSDLAVIVFFFFLFCCWLSENSVDKCRRLTALTDIPPRDSISVLCWKVKWSRENYYHNLSSPYCLRLASGDASGKIIVWDVVSGTAHCEIQEHSKPIGGKTAARHQTCLSAQWQSCQEETLSRWFAVDYLFSLGRCYCHSCWCALRFHSHLLFSVLLAPSVRLGVAVESGCISWSLVSCPSSQLHCSVEWRHRHQTVEKKLRWEYPLLFFWPFWPFQHGM